MSTTINSSDILMWRERIQACKASNLSIKHWCEENSIKPSTYHYWLKKLDYQSECMGTEWAEVKVKQATVSDSLQPIMLYFHDFTIEIPVEFSKVALAEVLFAIRSVC